MAAESDNEVSARQKAALQTWESPTVPNGHMAERVSRQRRRRLGPWFNLTTAVTTGLDVFLDAVADRIARHIKD